MTRPGSPCAPPGWPPASGERRLGVLCFLERGRLCSLKIWPGLLLAVLARGAVSPRVLDLGIPEGRGVSDHRQHHHQDGQHAQAQERRCKKGGCCHPGCCSQRVMRLCPRGLGWEISSLHQFYSVLPGLRRLGPNAPFIVWFSPGLVGAKLNRVWFGKRLNL